MEEDKINYKLDILNVDGTQPKDLVIEKRGQVIRFSLNEIEGADRINKKNLKELTAKRDYEAAVMQNIEQNNQYGAAILAMPVEERYTVHMYQEAYGMKKACDLKIAEIEAAIAEDAEELAVLAEAIPQAFVVPEVPAEETPEEPDEEAVLDAKVEQSLPTNQE